MKQINYPKLAKPDFVQQLSSINSIIIHQPWIHLNYIYKGTNRDFESPYDSLSLGAFWLGQGLFGIQDLILPNVIQHFFITKVRDKYCELHED